MANRCKDVLQCPRQYSSVALLFCPSRFGTCMTSLAIKRGFVSALLFLRNEIDQTDRLAVKPEDSVLLCPKFMEEFKVETLRVSLEGFKLLTYLLTYCYLASSYPAEHLRPFSPLTISKMTANITFVADIQNVNKKSQRIAKKKPKQRKQ